MNIKSKNSVSMLLSFFFVSVCNTGVLNYVIPAFGCLSTVRAVDKDLCRDKTRVEIKVSMSPVASHYDEDITDYARGCVEQMGEVDNSVAKNLYASSYYDGSLTIFDGDDYDYFIDAGVVSNQFASSVKWLDLTNFKKPVGWVRDEDNVTPQLPAGNSEPSFEDSQQYMVLAHELGHVCNKDTEVRFAMNVGVRQLLSSACYGAVYVISQCVSDNPIAQWLVSVCGLGATAYLQHSLLPRLVSNCRPNFMRRCQERRADMFALRQARCTQDIIALRINLENSKKLLSCDRPVLHPHPDERIAYIRAYEEKMQNQLPQKPA